MNRNREPTDDRALDYYPPRARWHTRLWFQISQALRRAWRRVLRLNEAGSSKEVSVRHVVLSLAIPGFSFFIVGHRLVGGLFFAAYAVAGMLFVVELGFRAGSIAYGLVISVHATSITFLERYWMRESSFGLRLGMALLTLMAVWGLVYSPLTHLAQERWVFPLRVGDRVLIVQRRVAPKALQRGDLVAYLVASKSGVEGEPVYVEAGMGMDPVLALPGDHVRFSQQAVFVNERAYPAAPHMPGEGEFIVPEKVWFIWPSLGIYRGGGVAEGNVSAALQQVAMVHQSQIIGRPFKRWFGRQQWP